MDERESQLLTAAEKHILATAVKKGMNYRNPPISAREVERMINDALHSAIHCGVASVVALKAITATIRTDRMLCYVENDSTPTYNGLFRFDAQCEVVESLPEYVAPTAGTGRWIQMTKGVSQHDAMGGLSGAGTYHLSKGQVDALVLEGDIRLTNARTPTAHGSGHINTSESGDPIDGDKLDITYTPVNYTPVLDSPRTTALTHLASHLKGIDLDTPKTVSTQVETVGPTTLFEIPIAEGECYGVEADILARQADNSDALHQTIKGLFTRSSGGNVAQIGATKLICDIRSDEDWNVGFAVDTVNQKIQIQFTGEAEITIDVVGKIRYYKI
jgi:hypothetical protein